MLQCYIEIILLVCIADF